MKHVTYLAYWQWAGRGGVEKQKAQQACNAARHWAIVLENFEALLLLASRCYEGEAESDQGRTGDEQTEYGCAGISEATAA
ncbi:hypothetical protein CGERO_06740 [Corynebacterium gerontici]|uniref:Uncharacterized protein n=1 Tax=Corynebacterium gerontici TaxID=2079234 RepID=A0A3G6J3W3_9CORY|nr:hypothetical protein CGERO_06740 [Corynebacterium gerontici]